MARIRTIKPEFFTSLTVAGLSVEARLTFIGLWTHCDDEGRCVADARLVRAAVWPLDDRLTEDVGRDLEELTAASLIVHYEVEGRLYFQVRGWSEHQRINRPTTSKIPTPEQGTELPFVRGGTRVTSGFPASPQAHARLTEDAVSAHDRKGKEQGKERNEGTNTPSTADATTLPLDVESLLVTPDGATEHAKKTIDEHFDDLWAIYPRKVGKQDARRAWDKARKRASIEAILSGATRLANDPNLPDDVQYIPHPSTWLTRGGWDDDPLPPRRDRTPKARQEIEQEATDRMFDRAMARAIERDQLEAAAKGEPHA